MEASLTHRLVTAFVKFSLFYTVISEFCYVPIIVLMTYMSHCVDMCICFIVWQMMNAMVNRPAPVARQKQEIFCDAWSDVVLRRVPLQADEAGYGGEVSITLERDVHMIVMVIVMGR
jgi:hypothetical protein